MSHQRRVLFVVFIISLFIVGCGGSTTGGSTGSDAGTGQVSTGSTSTPPSSSQEPPQGTPKEKLPLVRVATITPKGSSGFFLMADHKGFFEEEGIRVEYVFIESATNIVKAMIAGEADVADINPGLFLDAIATGNADIKVVGAGLSGLAYNIYAKNEIKSPKDMEGKTAGVAAPGSFLDEMITLWMANGGADPSKANRVASGGSAASFQALLVGKVDAVAAGPEYLPMAEEDPNIHMVAVMGEEMPDYINFAIVARKEMIEERREDLKAFMRAHSRGLRHAIENRDETIALAADTLKLPKEDEGLALAYDVLVDGKLISPDLSVTEKQIDFMLSTRIIMGTMDKKIPVEQVWDPSVQQEAMANIGPFSWPN